MMADVAPKLNRPATMRGVAALVDMLDQIGAGDGDGDHKVAKILVDAELELRDLVRFALAKLSLDR